MPKGPPPSWTSRDCRFDHLVGAVAGKGFGQTLHYTGIENPVRALDIKRGFYRCAKHRAISAAVEWLHSGQLTTVSANWPPDREADGTYTLRLTLFKKAQARKRHLEKYGTDRANWPYNPRAPKSQADIDAWAERGLNEKGHRTR